MRSTRHWLGIITVAVVVVSGCSSSGSQRPAPGPTGPDRALIAKAQLAPCPPSSTTSVAGGLPDLTLNCLGNGPAVHLSGLTGKPTVVNLWARWCGPCHDEASFLSSVYDEVRHKVRFLGIDVEDDPALALAAGAAVTPPVRYPSVEDPDKKALIALHYPGPPATLFVDASGKIVHRHSGKYTSAAALRHDLATYLHVT